MATYSTALQRIYGASSRAVSANLTPVVLNWPKGDGKSPQSVRVYVNRHVMAARLRNVNTQMNAYCKAHGVGYTLRDVGCFNWRRIAGSLSLSMHSGAIAIDINPSQNPWVWGRLVTDMKPWMVNIFKANGFLWGGDWAHHDAMHYELCVHTEPIAVPTTPTQPPASLRYVIALSNMALRSVPTWNPFAWSKVATVGVGSKLIVIREVNGWLELQKGSVSGWVQKKNTRPA